MFSSCDCSDAAVKFNKNSIWVLLYAGGKNRSIATARRQKGIWYIVHRLVGICQKIAKLGFQVLENEKMPPTGEEI
jgi:hypothetical protein